MSLSESDIDMKFDEMDHILDQISNYTNQGIANVFTEKESEKPIPIAYAPSYVKPKHRVSVQIDMTTTQTEKIAVNHIFRSHPYNIKYHS